MTYNGLNVTILVEICKIHFRIFMYHDIIGMQIRLGHARWICEISELLDSNRSGI